MPAKITAYLFFFLLFSIRSFAVEAVSEINNEKTCNENTAERSLGFLSKSGLIKQKLKGGFEIFNGLSLQGQYGLQIDRVDLSDIFFRKDSLSFGPKVSVTENIFKNVLGENLEKSMIELTYELPLKFEYIRFSKKLCQLTTFSLPRNFPLDSERALRMRKSDYFKMDARNKLGLTPQLFESVQNEFGISLSAKAALEVSYQAHVIRLGESKVRLRMLGLKLPETSVRLGFGPGSTVSFTNWNLLDKVLSRKLHLNLLDLQLGRVTKGKAQKTDLLEYEIDLQDPEARKAYDQLLAGLFRLSHKDPSTGVLADIFNPARAYGEFREINEQISTQIRKLEKLQSVKKIMDANSSAQGFYSRVGVGLILGKSDEKNSFSNYNIVNHVGRSDQYYKLINYRTEVHSNFLLNWSRYRKDSNLDMLFSTNSNHQEMQNDHLVMTLEQTDRRMSKTELRQFLSQLRRNVTEDFYNQVILEMNNNWFAKTDSVQLGKNSFLNKLGFDKSSYDRARLFYQIIINPTFTEVGLSNSTKPELQAAIKNFLVDLRKRGLGLDLLLSRGNHKSKSERVLPAEKEAALISQLAEKIIGIYDLQLEQSERISKIEALRADPIFSQVGPGLIIKLISDRVDVEQLKRIVGFSVSLAHKEAAQPVVIQWDLGLKSPGDIFSYIKQVRAFTDDNNHDLELLASQLYEENLF
jgi:hypothetical protein